MNGTFQRFKLATEQQTRMVINKLRSRVIFSQAYIHSDFSLQPEESPPSGYYTDCGLRLLSFTLQTIQRLLQMLLNLSKSKQRFVLFTFQVFSHPTSNLSTRCRFIFIHMKFQYFPHHFRFSRQRQNTESSFDLFRQRETCNL